MARVRIGKIYRYEPSWWDLYFPSLGNTLRVGQVVKVINLPGAPPANTTGQCYVADPETGKFLCMVSVASLTPVKAAQS